MDRPTGRRLRLALAVSYSAVLLAVGAAAQRARLPAFAAHALFGRRPAPAPLDPPPLAELPRASVRGRTAVLLCAGQSNAANYGSGRADAGPGCAAFYVGRLYRLRDPVPGADGLGGSVWSRLAPRLLETGGYDAVVVAAVAQGDTRAADWAPGGVQWPRLAYTARDLLAAGLAPTHVLWHQGEADYAAGTGPADYAASLQATAGGLRALGVTAPVCVAIATRVGGDVCGPLRRAQADLAGRPGFRPGPDTDALGPELRRGPDDAHLSAAGLDRAARLWLDALNCPAPPVRSDTGGQTSPAAHPTGKGDPPSISR